MPPTVHIEPLCEHVGIIRVFPPGGKFGDPFLWAAAMKRIGPGEVEIVGVVEAPSKVISWAILRHLRTAGEHTLWQELHTHGNVRRLKRDLTRVDAHL